MCFENYTRISIFIHFLGSRTSWAQLAKRESGWSLCLFAICRVSDFHLARIIASKPCLVEVAHQYRWFLTPFIQSFIRSQPLSLLNLSMPLVMEHATCQMSKKWDVFGWLSRIHFAIPRCLSEINTFDGDSNRFKISKCPLSAFQPRIC